MNTPIKIALVDDQNLFREGMLLVLNTFEELDVILDTSSGQEFLDRVEDNMPDLVLMDYTMPEMDGYETMKKLQERYPDIKVIILTMHYDENLMAFMMQNGANGYLLKDEKSTVVKEAISEVIKNGRYFPSYVSQALLNELQIQSTVKQSRQKSNINTQSFSQREKEIMAHIGKLNRKEIANTLFISIKTVDFHLKNLRDKTNTSSTSELVRFALKNGYQD